jgi:hypothetical protein
MRTCKILLGIIRLFVLIIQFPLLNITLFFLIHDI